MFRPPPPPLPHIHSLLPVHVLVPAIAWYRCGTLRPSSRRLLLLLLWEQVLEGPFAYVSLACTGKSTVQLHTVSVPVLYSYAVTSFTSRHCTGRIPVGYRTTVHTVHRVQTWGTRRRTGYRVPRYGTYTGTGRLPQQQQKVDDS